MIVRIIGEAQYTVPDWALKTMNRYDDAVQSAMSAKDTAGFRLALHKLLATVRDQGTAVPDNVLTPSDLVLPAPDSEITQVAAMLGDEGLIPG